MNCRDSKCLKFAVFCRVEFLLISSWSMCKYLAIYFFMTICRGLNMLSMHEFILSSQIIFCMHILVH